VSPVRERREGGPGGDALRALSCPRSGSRAISSFRCRRGGERTPGRPFPGHLLGWFSAPRGLASRLATYSSTPHHRRQDDHLRPDLIVTYEVAMLGALIGTVPPASGDGLFRSAGNSSTTRIHRKGRSSSARGRPGTCAGRSTRFRRRGIDVRFERGRYETVPLFLAALLAVRRSPGCERLDRDMYDNRVPPQMSRANARGSSHQGWSMSRAGSAAAAREPEKVTISRCSKERSCSHLLRAVQALGRGRPVAKKLSRARGHLDGGARVASSGRRPVRRLTHGRTECRLRSDLTRRSVAGRRLPQTQIAFPERRRCAA